MVDSFVHNRPFNNRFFLSAPISEVPLHCAHFPINKPILDVGRLAASGCTALLSTLVAALVLASSTVSVWTKLIRNKLLE